MLSAVAKAQSAPAADAEMLLVEVRSTTCSSRCSARCRWSTRRTPGAVDHLPGANRLVADIGAVLRRDLGGAGRECLLLQWPCCSGMAHRDMVMFVASRTLTPLLLP